MEEDRRPLVSAVDDTVESPQNDHRKFQSLGPVDGHDLDARAPLLPQSGQSPLLLLQTVDHMYQVKQTLSAGGGKVPHPVVEGQQMCSPPGAALHGAEEG